jgi:hypothetical protein
VADVFRRFGPAFRDQHGASLSAARWRAMTAIENCRTAALGGHVERCGDCGHQRIAYNSCLMGKFSNGESADAPSRNSGCFERGGSVSTSLIVPISPYLPGATVGLATVGQ